MFTQYGGLTGFLSFQKGYGIELPASYGQQCGLSCSCGQKDIVIFLLQGTVGGSGLAQDEPGSRRLYQAYVFINGS